MKRLAEVEAEALELEPGERARLAAKLLASLDELSDDQIESLWTAEAARRDADLDVAPEKARPAEQVFAEAKARFR